MATPNPRKGFSVQQITYPIVSALGLIDEHSVEGYVRAKRSIVRDSYIMQLKAQGNVKWTPTRVYRRWKDNNNKELESFQVTAAVTGSGAGASVTVTLLASSHMASGTLSVPAVGYVFEDDTTGIQYEVVSVNKTTAGAHTAVLNPTDITDIATITTDSFFKLLGRPNAQEASFQQDGTYNSFERQEGTLSTIRTNKAYTDYTMMERTEYEGQTFYMLDEGDIDRRHIAEVELQLMKGKVRNNTKALGNENTNSLGLVENVKLNGNVFPSVTLNDAFFKDQYRSSRADGTANEYDILADPEYILAWSDYLKTANPAQVIINVNNGEDIKAVFDYDTNVKIYNTRMNVKEYVWFNSARTHGADASKSYDKGTALWIPKGEYYNNEAQGQVPYLRTRYWAVEEGGKINTLSTDGAMAGKNTTMNLEVALVSYEGLEAYDLSSFNLVTLDLA